MANAPDNSTQRILVIDDDRKLCRLIRDYLEPMNYAVEFVHSGPEGVDRATTEPWSAVLLDVMLPGLDGFEVLKRIRAKTDVPVLVGFGVSTPEQVKLLSSVADGAIVGSALVRRVGELAAEGPEGVAKGVESYIADLVNAAR